MARFQIGGQSLRIEGVATPTGDDDAANKAYVDGNTGTTATHFDDTDSIAVTQEPNSNVEIDVVLSQDANNALTIETDGLRVIVPDADFNAGTFVPAGVIPASQASIEGRLGLLAVQLDRTYDFSTNDVLSFDILETDGAERELIGVVSAPITSNVTPVGESDNFLFFSSFDANAANDIRTGEYAIIHRVNSDARIFCVPQPLVSPLTADTLLLLIVSIVTDADEFLGAGTTEDPAIFALPDGFTDTDPAGIFRVAELTNVTDIHETVTRDGISLTYDNGLGAGIEQVYLTDAEEGRVTALTGTNNFRIREADGDPTPVGLYLAEVVTTNESTSFLINVTDATTTTVDGEDFVTGALIHRFQDANDAIVPSNTVCQLYIATAIPPTDITGKADVDLNNVSSEIPHDQQTAIVQKIGAQITRSEIGAPLFNGQALGGDFNHLAVNNSNTFVLNFADADEADSATHFLNPDLNGIGPTRVAADAEIIFSVTRAINSFTIVLDNPVTLLASDSSDGAEFFIFSVDQERIRSIEGGTYSNGVLTIDENDTTISPEPPTLPEDGDLWLDIDTGQEYTFFGGAWGQTGGYRQDSGITGIVGQSVTDAQLNAINTISTLATRSLDNLTATGQGMFDELATRDLDNLTPTGQSQFDAKLDLDLSNIVQAGQDLFDAKVNLDLGNLSTAGDAIIDAKANVGLDNLSTEGTAILDAKANVGLDNLSTAGTAILDAKANVTLSNLTDDTEAEQTAIRANIGYAVPTLGQVPTSWDTIHAGAQTLGALSDVNDGAVFVVGGSNAELSLAFNGSNFEFVSFLGRAIRAEILVNGAGQPTSSLFQTGGLLSDGSMVSIVFGDTGTTRVDFAISQVEDFSARVVPTFHITFLAVSSSDIPTIYRNGQFPDPFVTSILPLTRTTTDFELLVRDPVADVWDAVVQSTLIPTAGTVPTSWDGISGDAVNFQTVNPTYTYSPSSLVIVSPGFTVDTSDVQIVRLDAFLLAGFAEYVVGASIQFISTAGDAIRGTIRAIAVIDDINLIHDFTMLWDFGAFNGAIIATNVNPRIGTVVIAAETELLATIESYHSTSTFSDGILRLSNTDNLTQTEVHGVSELGVDITGRRDQPILGIGNFNLSTFETSDTNVSDFTNRGLAVGSVIRINTTDGYEWHQITIVGIGQLINRVVFTTDDPSSTTPNFYTSFSVGNASIGVPVASVGTAVTLATNTNFVGFHTVEDTTNDATTIKLFEHSWDIRTEGEGYLVFRAAGTDVMSIDINGNMRVTGTVTENVTNLIPAVTITP